MKSNKSASGVSMVIRRTMSSFKNESPLIEKKTPSEFSIKLANTLEERAAVFHLGYQVYLKKGYLKENATEMLVQNYDVNSETAILMIQDRQKNIVGSVTLVFDGAARLPAEKIYSEELRTLRRTNEKIVEISRLVIDPKYRNSKEILVLLFNYLYIYSYFVKNYTCLAIEVNPRHTAYYQELLHFKSIGSEKPCPNVQSAPAILMYLPLSHGIEEVKRISKMTEGEKNNRSLYSYFIKPNEQMLVANYLKKQAKPMTAEEKIYFGFSDSGISRAVCV
jgi:hypothetical protein